MAKLTGVVKLSNYANWPLLPPNLAQFSSAKFATIQCRVIRHSNQFGLQKYSYKTTVWFSTLRDESHFVSEEVGEHLVILITKYFFVVEDYRGGWVHDKARRRSGRRSLWPSICYQLEPAEAGRKAKPWLGERLRRRSCLSGCPGRRKPRGRSSRLLFWPGATVFKLPVFVQRYIWWGIIRMI